MKLEITSQCFSEQEKSYQGNRAQKISEMLDEGAQAAKDGNRAEARRLFLCLTETEPENETAWLWLASLSEYPEELIIFLQHILKINPRSERAIEWNCATQSLLAERFIKLGSDAAQENRPEFARQCFLKAAHHNSQNEVAWLNLSALADLPEEKTVYIRRVLEINPHHEEALSALDSIKRENLRALLKQANFATISGERETALELLDEVMRSAPDLEEAWILKAYLAEDSEEKIACYVKVLDLNPENEAAQAGLFSLQELLQKAEEQKSFAEALKEVFEAGNFSEAEISDQAAAPENFSAASVKDIEEMPDARLQIEMPEESKTFENYINPAQNFSNAESFSDFRENQSQNETAVSGETDEFSPQIFSDAETEFQPNVKDLRVYEEISEANENVGDTDFFNLSEDNYALVELEEIGADSFYEPVENSDVFSFQADEIHLADDFKAAENFDSDSQDAADFVCDANLAAGLDVENVFFAAPVETDSTATDFTEKSDAYQNEVSLASQTASRNLTKQNAKSFACPFCYMMNEPQAIICSSCRTMLSLADLEPMLAYQAANPDVLQTVIEKLELLRSDGNIGVDELTLLAVAHFNAKNLQSGLNCLQEAARLAPNDIGLISKINFLKIRLVEPQTASAPKNFIKSSTIMIVDDNPTILKLVSGKLERCGHKVIPAAGGEEALTKINGVTPDLILLDIAMPKMDGYQVCKLIRDYEETKDVPVLMISSKESVFDESRGKIAGSTGFISKPFGPETLMRTIQTYLS